MKFNSIQKNVGLILVLACALFGFSCQSNATSNSQTSDRAAGTTEAANAPTPREAYRMLYEAVKAKDSARIQQLMSNNTMTFAGFASQQQNQSLEKFFANGLTATTFADTLPERRDERVNGNYGAVEVYNQKDNRWEDLPFVLENGGWKIAIGDAFKGDYKSPGKGQAQREMEASGAMGNPANLPAANTNAANTKPAKTEADSSGKAKDKTRRERVTEAPSVSVDGK